MMQFQTVIVKTWIAGCGAFVLVDLPQNISIHCVYSSKLALTVMFYFGNLNYPLVSPMKGSFKEQIRKEMKVS
jgi:hypothetical protein